MVLRLHKITKLNQDVIMSLDPTNVMIIKLEQLISVICYDSDVQLKFTLAWALNGSRKIMCSKTNSDVTQDGVDRIN